MERFTSRRERKDIPPKTTLGFAGDPEVIHDMLVEGEFRRRGIVPEGRRRRVLILDGGGQKGRIQAAVGMVLTDRGLLDTFDAAVTVSAGTANFYNGLAGYAEQTATIYEDENIANQLFNPYRFWHVFDPDRLEWVFRYEKPINTSYFRSRTTEFIAGLTNAQTGEGKFVNVKEAQDPIAVVMASMCLPVGNRGRTVEVDGVNYLDGGIANPLPISWTIDNLKPDDILVITNGNLGEARNPNSMKLVAKLAALYGMSKPIQELLAAYPQTILEEQRYITGEKPLPEGMRIGAIYVKQSPVGIATMNHGKLKEAANAAQQFTEDLLTLNNFGL